MTRGLRAIPKRNLARVEAKLARMRSFIKSRREALELSQEELADTLNLTTETIGGIEQGRRTPSLPVLILLAEALEFEIELDAK